MVAAEILKDAHTAMSDPGPVWLRGLRWLESSRQGFALTPGAEPEPFRLKALGELAGVCEVLCRPGPAALPAASVLLEFAWEQFGRGEVLAAFLERRPFPVLGTIYAVFERRGWRHERTRELLAGLGRPGAMAAAARGPRPSDRPFPVTAQYGPDGVAVLCLALALAWESLALPCPWSRARLFPLTWLARRPEASDLSVPEAYSLTHTVFFMTDWGAEPEGLGEAERAYLAARAGGWMASFQAAGNFDLYSELAITLACAGAPVPGEVEGVLGQAQQEDGRVPGPTACAAEGTPGIEDPERRRFVGAYHTTLVATLASFAAGVGLARGSRPAAVGG